MKALKTATTKATPSPRKRVFLVDDHPMMRDGMAHLINVEDGLICCGGAGSAEEAMSEIPKCQPDIVVTDITLPKRNGLELIKDLRATHPDLPVVVYSMHEESIYAERALRAGARGYLMKEAGSERMLEMIRRALQGDVSVSPAMAAKILNVFSGRRQQNADSPLAKLSDREFDVYQLIGEGKSTKEIAAQLNLSHKTVAVHRGHIKAKLGFSTAAELVHAAIRWSAG